jgi:DNA-binding CsgD family transcriptional regulator
MGSRLVGRVAEAGTLDRLRADAAAGSGAVVVITGEAGIGKTAVVEELVARASATGATVLTGRAGPEEGAPAFWPWLRLLGSVPAGTLPGLTPSLLETTSDDGSAAARFRVMHAAVRELLAAAGHPGGLILVLEDMHWADPASLSLLAMLAREAGSAPLLIVATARTLRPEPPGAAILPLSRWGQAAVAAYLARHADGPVHPSWPALVHRLGGGNPLYTRELVRAVAVPGKLRLPAADPELPDSLLQLVGRRLSALGPACRDLLGSAAALGADIDVSLLARVTAPGLDVEPALTEAIEAGVLAEDPWTPSRLRFAHELLREARYAQLTRPERIQAHRRTAETLDAALPPGPGPLAGSGLGPLAGSPVGHGSSSASGTRAAEIARHRVRAAVDDESRGVARGACENAAGEAARRLDHHAAATWLGEAVALAPDDPWLRLARAEAACRDGRLTLAVADCSLVLDVAETAGLTDLAVAAALVVRGYGGQVAPAALRLCERARALLDPSAGALPPPGDPRDPAPSADSGLPVDSSLSAGSSLPVGSSLPAGSGLPAGSSLSAGSGLSVGSSLSAGSGSPVGSPLSVGSGLPAGSSLSAGSRPAAGPIVSGTSAGAVAYAELVAHHAYLLVEVGQFARAEPLSREAMALAEQTGDPRAIAAAVHARHEALDPIAAAEEVLELGRRSCDLAAVSGRADAELWGRLWRLDGLLTLGDLPAFDTELPGLVALAERIGWPVARWHVLRARAARLLLAGRPAACRDVAEEAFALAGTFEEQPGRELHSAFLASLTPFTGELPGWPGDLAGAATRFGAEPIAAANIGRLAMLSDDRPAGAECLRHLGAALPGLPPDGKHTFLVVNTGEIAAWLGDRDLAAAAYTVLLPWASRFLNTTTACHGAIARPLGTIAAALGDHEAAEQHFTDAIAMEEKSGAAPFAALAFLAYARSLHERDARRTRRLAGEALAIARRLGLPAIAASATALTRDELTAREREIAVLAAEGLPNRSIADRLHISERTVESHVRNALAKLGVTNRTQLAAHLRTQP